MGRHILPDQAEVSRIFQQICAEGDCLHLRQQQRVPVPPADKAIVLREGVLAVDAMPTKEKLQVLDFLVAGDVVSVSTVLPAPRVSLRAITSASLVAVEPPELSRTLSVHDYWAFLMAQCANQMARVHIHQLMTGRLETEPRVASFILALALRNIDQDARSTTVALPMSRDDIANYLVINCDTLSRTMMKFCDAGLIERESRHAIRIVDLDGLKKRSPLATLLASSSTGQGYKSQVVKPAPTPAVHFNFNNLNYPKPLPTSASPPPYSGAEQPLASRVGF